MKGFDTLTRNGITCLALILASLTLLALPVDKTYSSQFETHTEWSYQGKTGLDYWGSLDPSFIECEKGVSQSPININTSNVIGKSDLENIRVDYSNSDFTIINKKLTLEILPNDGSNSIYIGDVEYVLGQLHFHYPSEHELNGKKFPAEIHFVHQNHQGQFAVFGLFVKQGKENKVIQKFFHQLSKEVDQKKDIEGTINIESLLPERREYFRYEGSLTTPPCSENVKWLVLNHSIEMSAEQLNELQKLFPTNSRPVQSIGKRKITIQK